MKLPFLNRTAELDRLKKAFTAKSPSLVCLYGRRRCGKSRLLQQALKERPHVYFSGNDREAALQRQALAMEIGRLIPGFELVEYHSWDVLFQRWFLDAPAGAVLALDEFPFLAAASPELPGILQKHIDKDATKPLHICLCGSSQRMMHGLVLDASAPLYGRAREIMKIQPLSPYCLQSIMRNNNGEKTVEAFAAWGGVPRYWELAMEYSSTFEAIRELVLNPLGVLYGEPERLLSDQMRDTRQAASLLSIISQGCHRLSEIAARLEKPATSLTRPLAILVDLGIITREVPFGASFRDSKRTLYSIADPFLRFWLKFAEPNHSLIEAGLIDHVGDFVSKQWPGYVGTVWEQLSRESIPYLSISGRRWKPASRWWGKAVDGVPMEFDIVSNAFDNDKDVLVGEARPSCSGKDLARLLADLKTKALHCPAFKGKNLSYALWIMQGAVKKNNVFTADDVIGSLKGQGRPDKCDLIPEKG
jgi:uncharacterized protein